MTVDDLGLAQIVRAIGSLALAKSESLKISTVRCVDDRDSQDSCDSRGSLSQQRQVASTKLCPVLRRVIRQVPPAGTADNNVHLAHKASHSARSDHLPT